MATETTTLKLTAADLAGMVNLTGENQLLRYGNEPGIPTEAKLVNILEIEERSILSSLPEHYRRVITGEISGEILVNSELGARGGETTLQVAFYPIVADSLILYKNYFDNELPWESRSYDYALTEVTDYTVNEATGAITLTEALESGDFVYAEYRHNAGEMFITVRDLVLKAARLELYLVMPNWNDSTDTIREMREGIDNKIFAFNAGEDAKGVSEIDDVKFVKETRKSRRETKKLPWMRGAI